MKEIYAQQGQEVISLFELKSYLKIDFDNQDSLLNDLIRTARETAERVLNYHIVRKNVRQINVANNLQVVQLIQVPVIQINSVVVINNDKAEITLDASEYYFNKFNCVCITKLAFLYNKVITSYDVGYAENYMMPVSLKTGMLLHIAAMYDSGDAMESIPKAIIDFYQPYRRFNF